MTRLAQRVYDLLKTVPKGRVTTYKALAEALGTRGYRAIGQILKRNPHPFPACPERTSRSEASRRIPCHRVVSADGTIGGFMGNTRGKAIQKKIAMLESEGVRVVGQRIVRFPQVFYAFEIGRY